MTKIMICGFFGWGNAGDEAILTVMLSSLKEGVPDAEFTILTNYPRLEMVSQHYGCNAIGLCQGTRALFTLLSTIKKMDLFLLGGGGLTNEINKVYGYLPMKVAELMKIPRMIYAQGVGPFVTFKTKEKAKKHMSRANIITVRDKISEDALRSIGVTLPIHVTADPAINLKSEPMEEDYLRKTKPLISVSPNVLGRYDIILIKKFSKILDQLITILEAEVVFILMYPQCGDLAIAERIVSTMKQRNRIKVVREIDGMSPAKLKYLIGQSDLLMGQRLHSLIFAASENVPLIGIKTPFVSKIESFLEQIQQPDKILDLTNMTVEDMVKKSVDTWNNQDVIKKQLKDKVNRLKNYEKMNSKLAIELVNESKCSSLRRGSATGITIAYACLLKEILQYGCT